MDHPTFRATGIPRRNRGIVKQSRFDLPLVRRAERQPTTNRYSFVRQKMLLYDQKHLIGRSMRYSREHKLETHARIIKRASVRLREKGAHGVGVADLMKEAGLTHGGFYAHFDSREALVIEAVHLAHDRSMEHWRKQSDQVAPEKQLPQIVETYLSTVHRDNPGHGCSIPALGAEIARESPTTRKAFAGKLDE